MFLLFFNPSASKFYLIDENNNNSPKSAEAGHALEQGQNIVSDQSDVIIRKNKKRNKNTRQNRSDKKKEQKNMFLVPYFQNCFNINK